MVCRPRDQSLDLLEGYLPDEGEMPDGPEFRELIDGPPYRLVETRNMYDSAIYSRASDNIVGTFWASLRPFIVQDDTDFSPRPRRAAAARSQRPETPPESEGDDSQSPQSSETQESEARSDVSSSVGYTELSTRPPLESAAVLLVQNFADCALFYGDPPSPPSTPQLSGEPSGIGSKSEPQDGDGLSAAVPGVCPSRLQVRRVPKSYSAHTPRNGYHVEAVDDGGLLLFRTNGDHRSVAIIEGKRALVEIVDGSPTVPDKVLAQIVGESIAQAFGDTRSRVSESEYVIIPVLIFPSFHSVLTSSLTVS